MKVIDSIEFAVFSPDQVRKMSAVKITVPDTYDEDGYPIEGGLADQRLGVIDPGLRCKSCGGRMKTCSGHFGHIELVRPVIHVGFTKPIFSLLKATCRKCSRMLDDASTIDAPKRAGECSHCGEKQGVIKFVKPTTFFEDDRRLLPNEIRERLEHINDEDLAKLGVKIRPEWLVLTLFSGAWLDSSYLRNGITTAYVDKDFIPTRAMHAVEGKVADFKTKIVLIPAEDEFIFYAQRKIKGELVVNPFLLYADLASLGGMGLTALQQVAEKHGLPQIFKE